MKFRELLNEEVGEVEEKTLAPIQEKFKRDVLGINEGIPGIPVRNMTTDDLNPEGTPANVQPDDDNLEEEKDEKSEEEIDEESELEEDISDADIRDLSDEEVEDLLDSIARTDAEKKEIDKNRKEYIKKLKTLKKTPDEVQKELKVFDKEQKLYPIKTDEEGRKSIADKFDKLMHRSAVTSRGRKEGETANYLGKRGIELEKDMKRLTRDQFYKLITKRPPEILGQNAKMKVSGGEKYKFVDISLPAYQGIIGDEKTKSFKVIKTCPSAAGCKVFCYASKGSYTMFPDVAVKASTVLTYLYNDFDGFVKQLKGELDREGKGAHELVMRWHDAGDIISKSYLDMMIDVAESTPDVIHYAYTKQIDMINKREDIPENLHFTKSLGGTEDELLDLDKDKTAQVVPEPLFSEFKKNAKKGSKMLKGKKVETYEFRPEDMKIIKQRVADRFKFDPETIITYDELVEIPYDKKDKHTPKWNVLVHHGHGDDAGMRRDVKTVLLFAH